MQILETAEQARQYVSRVRGQQKTIGLIPTMGALHEGHLSLVSESVRRCDVTVATIFVNPTQFGPGEDFGRYPRTLDDDLEQLSGRMADAVFVPATSEVYPEGCSTSVQPPRIAENLEGQFRPGHFEGVATVVLKLFHLLPADAAFFGKKDFQQVRVIESMVRDLRVPIEVVACEIVREPDGLAMSSRNRYLAAEDRQRALRLSGSLQRAGDLLDGGERDPARLEAVMREHLMGEEGQPGVDAIDYATVVDFRTLRPVERIEGEVVLLITARVGQTRLLDNREWTGSSGSMRRDAEG